MRCTKHPCEPAGVGVCPCCLRERLLDVLTAQTKAEAAAAGATTAAEENHGRRREKPLSFPRSVSPYVSSHSRRSQRLFYSTPQLGPLGNSSIQTSNFSCKSSSKPRGKFSIFTSIFGRKGDDSVRVSWWSSLLPGRKKTSRLFSVDVSDPTPAAAGGKTSVGDSLRKCGRRDRGMSPVRKMRSEEEETDLSTGYSSESSSRIRMKPSTMETAKKVGLQEEKQRRKVLQQQQRNPSGLVICLSPLMRPSPNHRHHRPYHGERNGWDASFSGEIKNSGKKRFPSNSSFCTNRSRKLTDFGRYP